MKKTLELYQEELKEIDAGILNVKSERQTVEQEIVKLEKKLKTLNKNRVKINNAISKIKAKNSCKLGTTNAKIISKIKITDMYEWSKTNEPIITMTLEDDNDTIKFYINDDKVLFNVWISDDEISGNIYHWTGSKLKSCCMYEKRFVEDFDDGCESEWDIKTKEKFSEYTANLVANKAIERAINA